MPKFRMKQVETVKDLFRNAEKFEDRLGDLTNDGADLPINGPYAVIDPRRVGYNYISYAFIESGADLPGIKQGPEEISRQFQDSAINNGLLVGTSLGDFDIIHRRTEQKQYTHAKFAVDSIDDDEVDYIQSIETYPIWAIARWHGQDIPKNKMFNDQEFNSISKLDSEILFELNRNPNKTPEQITARIEQRVQNNEISAIDSSDNLPNKLPKKVEDRLRSLRSNRVILGPSIGVTVNDLPLQHMIIGLKVEEIEESQLTEEKEELVEAMGTKRDPLPNEVIMRKLTKKFDDGWEMPYIVSGVGQNWADILAEIHIDNIQDMNDYADEIRGIEGVKSTRTHLITHEADNQPLVVNDPNYFD